MGIDDGVTEGVCVGEGFDVVPRELVGVLNVVDCECIVMGWVIGGLLDEGVVLCLAGGGGHGEMCLEGEEVSAG